MNFASYGFAFVFLPVALLLYYGAALSRFHRLRVPLLALLGLAFYAQGAGRPTALLILSILVNYGIARTMVRRPAATRLLLWIGVGLNLAGLLGFKYSAFVADTVIAAAGTGPRFVPLALPLAISFYSFQQIAFLIEVARGAVRLGPLHRYAACVLFFPTMIAGPITFYQELDPQLVEPPRTRAIPTNLLVGLTLIAFGMVKKTMVADTIALWVDPLFADAARGAPLPAAMAWGAGTAYWLQIYFDFSGYTDMAIGIARMFGIRITANFFSPIRSQSVMDYWRRWHISLGRFVNLYIFMPLAVPLSRWAITRDLGRTATFAAGTLVPTFVTMLAIGTWHGGNWTFVVFGLMHASFMVIAESWAYSTRKKRKGKVVTWSRRVVANVVTMTAVVLAMIPFRADTVHTAAAMWRSMAGLAPMGPSVAWPIMPNLGGAALLTVIVAAAAFAYLMPNSLQLMARFEPVLEWSKWRTYPPAPVRLRWTPTIGWALTAGVLLMLGLAFVARGSANFVYFGF